jgi:hypothetical protein
MPRILLASPPIRLFLGPTTLADAELSAAKTGALKSETDIAAAFENILLLVNDNASFC